jgi:hypothetical protein
MSMMSSQALVILVAVVAAVVGTAVARRRMPYEMLARNQPFTAVTYTIVGAVYGVYLAFTIIVVWERFAQAEHNATSEAVHLSEAWRDLQVLPPPARRTVEIRLRDYAESVVQREWPSIAAGKGADPQTARLYEELWREIYAVRTQAAGIVDGPFFGEAVQQMNAVGVQRRLRLLDSDSALPLIMWILLVGGGVVTVGFSYVVGAPHAGIQAWATAALAALVVFSLLLVAALQHPFAGDIGIKATAYESVLKSFQDRLQEEPPLK